MAINSGAIASALRPGVNSWFGLMYDRYPDQFQMIFDTETSNMAWEEDVNINGLGLATTKGEGMSVLFDTMSQAFKQQYRHVTYGLGFVITREAIEDNLYMTMAKAMTERLAFSMKQTKEIIAANVLNRAFNSSYTGADGKELCSTAHLLSKGGTISNTLAVAADLSEASLEQALIDIDSLLDDAGLRANVKGTRLIVPAALRFEAKRILGSDLQNDTANNAINAVKSLGMLPDGFTINNYLDDSDAWFIKTNCPKGMRHFVRRAAAVDNDTEFTSDNVRFKATERYSFGWTDFRGIYGSPGA